MNQGNNSSMLFSILFSMNDPKEHDITSEDILYGYSPNVNKCQIAMYSLVIECLSKGMSYEEIYSIIENIDIEEYRILKEEQQIYVKTRIKKDLNSRQNNELKNRGVINNE